MKIVINRCFGGYGLSPIALKAVADRKGLSCFFFVDASKEEGVLVSRPVGPDPTAVPKHAWWASGETDTPYSGEVHEISRVTYRYDPDVVAVVQELGKEAASGQYAELVVVEIPDGTENIDYYIHDYDGIESVHEAHRVWP